jgi:hypothetical protein
MLASSGEVSKDLYANITIPVTLDTNNVLITFNTFYQKKLAVLKTPKIMKSVRHPSQQTICFQNKLIKA